MADPPTERLLAAAGDTTLADALARRRKPPRWAMAAIAGLVVAALALLSYATSNKQRATDNAAGIAALRHQLDVERAQRDAALESLGDATALLQLRVDQLEQALRDAGQPVPAFGPSERAKAARSRQTRQPTPSATPTPGRSPRPSPRPTPSRTPTPAPSPTCTLYNPLTGRCVAAMAGLELSYRRR